MDKRLAVFSDERFTGRLDVGAAGSRLLKLTAFDFQSVHRKEYDRHRPDVIVGSSRGGAVAMNLDSGSTPLVLLCPAWRRWGTATTVKPGTVILHSEADDVVPFADSRELARASGLPGSALIVVGTDHRLADPEPLQTMLEACEGAVLWRKTGDNRTERPRWQNDAKPG